VIAKRSAGRSYASEWSLLLRCLSRDDHHELGITQKCNG
jgi:hypothetical protein